jgi:NDP-sugar pyrophosphorylase family protein
MGLPCVILAGGRGTRMRPTTDEIPKALVEVLGKPFADWQLGWLGSEGVEQVIYSIGYKGALLRDFVGDASRWGLTVRYVDEGEDLKGTGGALRLALDQGMLPDAFFLLYGDSFLPVSLPWVEQSWRESGKPALMTVMRNEERWDQSNVVLEDGRVALYDKSRPADRLGEMKWIDYGLSVLTRDVVQKRIQSGATADVSDLMHELSVMGDLAGLEVGERFYEVGSVRGLRDLEDYLRDL